MAVVAWPVVVGRYAGKGGNDLGIRESRFYYGDSYQKTFVSSVEDVRTDAAGTWVRLQQSAFYPASGGQPHDTGVLGDAVVQQVEADSAGVWHRIEGTLTAGDRVTGQIDWPRRFDFMQQHCGQHILSACFEQSLGALTSSFHMGDTYSSIDLAIADLTAQALAQVVEQANRWIWRDVPVVARFVTAKDLATMRLRKPPAVEQDIRIVTIEGLEDNACGGTHPSSTGQVGQILITKTERMRGGVRVTFVCGRRAVRVASELVDLVRRLCSGLSVGIPELPAAIASLQEQLRDSGRREHLLRGRIAEQLGADLAHHAATCADGLAVVIASLGDLDDVADLKRIAAVVVEHLEARTAETEVSTAGAESYAIALVGQAAERAHIVIQTSESGPVQANAVIRGVFANIDGKGGGNAKAAQGSAQATIADLLHAAQLVLAHR